MKSLGRVDVSQNFKLFMPTYGIPAGLHSHRGAHVSLETSTRSKAVVFDATTCKPIYIGQQALAVGRRTSGMRCRRRRLPAAFPQTHPSTPTRLSGKAKDTARSSRAQSVKFRWLSLVKF